MDKVRLNRLRRMAHRQGLRLERTRRRDPMALDYGRLQLFREDTVVCEATDMDVIEKFLTRRPR